MEANQVPNNTLLNKISGFEKEYVKQVPVIAGGRSNMEMEAPHTKPRRGRARKHDLGLIYQDQLTNFKGSGEEFNTQDSEVERDVMTRELGAGLTMTKEDLAQDAKLNQINAKMGGAKKPKKAPEVVEGSVLEVEAKLAAPMKRGRKPKQVAVVVEEKEQSKSPVKGPAMKRRANKIKEIMKSMNKTMIEASKYIKENKITY